MISLVAIAAIAVTSFFAFRYEHHGTASAVCAFCDRTVHPGTAYHVTEGGRLMTACCPRCGMHAQVNREANEPSQASATDVMTGETVPAGSATYVEGGDVEYCTHGDQVISREPHGVSRREYDRCLPTLVAFKTPQEAQAYQRQHGGRILTYPQALASVQAQ